MIDKEKLKYWAIELEKQIAQYQSVSIFAKELSKTQYLLDAIQDAKNLKINNPVDRLGNWPRAFELTDMYRFSSLSNALSSFSLLLEGWKLPSDIVT